MKLTSLFCQISTKQAGTTMMTSQSRSLLVLTCLVLVTSVMTSSDHVTLNEELPMLKDGETTTKTFHDEQLTNCEIRVEKIQVELKNANLIQQLLEQKKDAEILKLKLKHAEEMSLLKDEKLAALEETSRYKRELEDFTTALARVESKLREEFQQLKVANFEEHKKTRADLESQKIKLSTDQEATQSSITLLLNNYTNLNTKITDIESQMSKTQNQNIILKNLTTSIKSDDITNVIFEILKLNDKIFNISDQLTKYKNLQEKSHKKIMKNITESLAIQSLETKTYTEDCSSKIFQAETKIENIKEEISNTSSIRNKKMNEIKLKISLNEEQIEDFEEKISSLENNEISEIKKKLNKLEEKSVAQLKKLQSIGDIEMVKLGDNFYHYSKNKLSWHDAQKFCRSHGLELAALETAEENRLVVNGRIGKQVGSTSWLDGTDEGSEGNWRWSSTGQPLNYTAWRDGQPNGGSIENYMCLCSTSNTMSWCDCSTDGYSEYYICESKPDYYVYLILMRSILGVFKET